jgi:hypothetical protein
MKTFKFIGSVIVATMAVLLAGCSSTPRVEHVRAVRGQGPYQFGQEPEQRVLENGGKQYDRHVRSLQETRLRHEKAMVKMEYERREHEYARTNGLASAQQAQAGSNGQQFSFGPQRSWATPPPGQVWSQPPQSVVMTPPAVPVVLPQGGGTVPGYSWEPPTPPGGYRYWGSPGGIREVRDLNGPGPIRRYRVGP